MKQLLKKGNILNKNFYCHWICMILAGAGILASSALKAVSPFPLSFPEDIKAFRSIEGNKYPGNAELSNLPVPIFDLTGFWEDDVGGKYQIRQVGNTVVWYDNRKPTVENVFIGTIEDNTTLNGHWYDLPGGQLINNGSISFRIESNDRLVKINSSVYYHGTVITRTGGSTNGNCDLTGTWRDYIQGVGQSVFTFSPLGGGRYSMREEGLGNATGTATVNGNKVHLEWSSVQNGDAGYIDWELNGNCDTGLGNLVYTSGRTGTITDRIERISSITDTGCNIAGTWRHYIQGVGQSVFTFSPLGGGRYSMREEGLGNATGTATVNGSKVHLEWSSVQNGDAGYIDWEINSNCDTGLGNLVFTSGKTGTITDRIERISSITDTGCNIAGTWRHYIQGVGQSVFTFSPLGGGRYSMREEGLGNATGTATVNGNKVHLEWSSAQNRDAGYIDWELNVNCDTGLGNLVFTSGKTGTITDRIELISRITDTSSTAGGGICANPRTLQIMDEWLLQAIPPQKPTDHLRYESWGRLTGTTETATLRPAGTPDTNLTRCEYLWQQAHKLQSTNGLGTLMDYVLQHLK